MQARFRLFRRARPRRVVGADGVDRAFEKALPQRGLVLGRAHRRDHLHQEAVGIEAVDAEIRRRRLDGEMQAGAARGAHHLEALMAGEMDDVEMRAGDFREIERGLDGERLGDRGMRVFPVLQRALGLARFQLVARGIDQRAGFAVDAGDRIGPERGDGAEAVQQHVVGDRLHDAGHARHVELERADAELLGVARDFLDLLFRENLRMKDRSRRSCARPSPCGRRGGGRSRSPPGCAGKSRRW